MDEFEAWNKIIEEWKRVNLMKQLNQRLYDELGGSLMHILRYAEKNGIVLPNKDRLFEMIENIHKTTDAIKTYHRKINSSDEKLQQDKTRRSDGDDTEPIIERYIKILTVV